MLTSLGGVLLPPSGHQATCHPAPGLNRGKVASLLASDRVGTGMGENV